MGQLLIKSGKLSQAQMGSTPSDFEKAVFIPDTHIPFINETIWERILDFLKDFQPDRIFILGDFIDSYNVSSFAQDPELFGQLQKELNLGKYHLEQLREVCPRAKGVFCEGNHEARIKRWLWENPAIASLEKLKIENLLGLDELDFEFVEYGNYYNYNGFLVKHGDIVRMHSGYSAKAELEKMGLSGISGHTHRMAAHFKTDMGGQKVWYESGCLCNLKLPWANGSNNWQNGFAVSWHERNGNRFFLELIPIIKNRFVYGGRYYC